MLPPRPSPQQANQQAKPTQEALLIDYLFQLEKHKKGRSAIHIRLSDLRADNRREQHIRVAASTFDNLVRKLNGQLFQMANVDLILVFKMTSLEEVEAGIIKLRFLFSGDPLLSGDSEEPKDDTRFCKWYSLETKYDDLLKLGRDFQNAEEARKEQEKNEGSKGPGGLARGLANRGEPLSPRHIQAVEKALASADLANLLRRQSICAIVGKSPPQPVFTELFISIADLRNALLPNVNVSSSPWLFQHMTEALDRRVLSLLNRHDDKTLFGDVSINLNVATILSPEFLKFDDNIKIGARGSIVLELQKIDIFADLGSYLFARDFAIDRGFRICIDGLDHTALKFVDRERLGADLCKLHWDDKFLSFAPEEKQAFGDLVKRRGTGKVILCRCDNEAAIAFGQSVGITLFQGRYVEGQLAARNSSRSAILHRRR
jgi:hypothetical protein